MGCFFEHCHFTCSIQTFLKDNTQSFTCIKQCLSLLIIASITADTIPRRSSMKLRLGIYFWWQKSFVRDVSHVLILNCVCFLKFAKKSL